MSSVETKKLEKALTSKGFEESNTHHEMYWLSHDGKKTSIRTRISHSEREYGDGLLSQMSKQVKLSKSDFHNLVECPLTKEAYLAMMIAQGHIRLTSP
jgi:predicted RNA binding protein YcfA (HicA-like mRNA interferase family)